MNIAGKWPYKDNWPIALIHLAKALGNARNVAFCGRS